MTLLKIYSLDDIEEGHVIASLSEGKHLIGRGSILQVTDKRISRQHAVIEVEADKITLTSLHINPCFFKAFNGKTLTIIAKGEECELNDGDQFALLPEDCWFRIKVKHGSEDPPPNGTLSSKRSHENGCEEDDASKKPRLSTSEDTPQVHENKTSQEEEFRLELNLSQHVVDEDPELKPQDTLNHENGCNQENEELNTTMETSHTTETTQVAEEQPSEIKDEPLNDEEDISTAQTVTEIKQELEDVNEDPNVASGSGTRKTRRERCWYKERCFRKNPNHRDLFSHPGDEDYASDPEDDRPECPFGVACYRKNLDHRREYKHSTRPAPKPRSPQRAASPVNLPPRPRGRQTNPGDSEDDYDYNDPFIDDGSSDEYQPTDSEDGKSSESEMDVSEDLESQERRRMLKEAKKFIKKKK